MKRLFLTVFSVIGAAVVLLLVCIAALGDGLLHVYYLNIGQGDSILVRTPGMEYLLVDGGPDDTVLRELSAVIPFYERTIDVVMLSHPHADHVDGLVDVLQRYTVKQILITGVAYHYAGYDRFLELAREKHVPIIFVDGDNDYQLGTTILDIVYPLESFAGKHFDNLNNSSISFRLLYGGNRFYFSGDLEMEGEAKLIASGSDVRADVLKAGHHGSRTSNTVALLDLMKPAWAIISCGVDNSFGHPHAETIRHFQERGITMYRTDLDGRIELASDGAAITIRPAQ